MKMRNPRYGHAVLMLVALPALCASLAVGQLHAQTAITNDPPFYGPFNGVFLADGDGLEKKLNEHDSVLRADSAWTLYGWVWMDEEAKAPMPVAGIGDANEEYARYLALNADKLILWLGRDNSLAAVADVSPRKWHLLAAVFDGTDFHLSSDGQTVASGKLALGTTNPVLQLAPPISPWPNGQHFGGKIAGLTLLREALKPDQIRQISQTPPDFSLTRFEEGSKPWRVQTRGQAGYRAPQDPSTWPRSKALIPAEPSALYRPGGPAETPAIAATGDNQWTIGDWRLAPAPGVFPGFDSERRSVAN